MTAATDNLLAIRLHELKAALALATIAPGSHFLEIGAGTGHQALALQELGHSVEAVDLDDSPYRDSRVFPMTTFDGVSLPFDPCRFDVVFSSNVMEHVSHLEALLQESVRLLRPGGLSLHVIPTPTWRLWSYLTHFIWLPKRAISLLLGDQSDTKELGRLSQLQRSWVSAISTVIPRRHGAHGSAISELWRYRRKHWIDAFERAGLKFVNDAPAGLFYTNSQILGAHLSLSTRQRFAHVLGASCRIYCFRKPDSTLDSQTLQQHRESAS